MNDSHMGNAVCWIDALLNIWPLLVIDDKNEKTMTQGAFIDRNIYLQE